jgi:hypothetical protein
MQQAGFGLYLQTAEGHRPGVETVALLLLDFADALKEIAEYIDPEAQIEVEFAWGPRAA